MTRLVSQEEGRLLRKSQRLWDQLVQTEERAREIMLEYSRKFKVLDRKYLADEVGEGTTRWGRSKRRSNSFTGGR